MKIFTAAVILVLLVMGFATAGETHACSGGADYPIEAILAQTDIIVEAVVTLTDDVRQNVVLHIDRYLYGGPGPEFILLSLTDPNIIARAVSGHNSGCQYLESELAPGTASYFFLSRQPDGRYVVPSFRTDSVRYDFSNPEVRYTFYSAEIADGNYSIYTEYTLDEDQFVQFILDFGQGEIREPLESFGFPRLAPLKITTRSGMTYVLPIDSRVAVSADEGLLRRFENGGLEGPVLHQAYLGSNFCEREDCIAISPDSTRVVWRYLSYNDSQPVENVLWNGLSRAVPGRMAQFSSTSDAIAVWSEDQVSVYTVTMRYTFGPDPLPLRQIALRGPVDSLPAQAAWSPDGRTFAWSDADGLWTLDVYSAGAVPRLVLAATDGDIPVALGYSPQGQYIHVQQGDVRATFDPSSGYTLPDGIVSPDERILLAFDTDFTAVQSEKKVAVCQIVPVIECTDLKPVIIRDNGDVTSNFYRIVQIEWRNTYSFVMVLCNDGETDYCIVDQWDNLYYNDRFFSSYNPVQGNGFDYLPQSDSLAIVQDGTSLNIDGETIDLSTWLDSEISEVQWMTPLFYTSLYPVRHQ